MDGLIASEKVHSMSRELKSVNAEAVSVWKASIASEQMSSKVYI
jgi:hypothetical protein